MDARNLSLLQIPGGSSYVVFLFRGFDAPEDLGLMATAPVIASVSCLIVPRKDSEMVFSALSVASMDII